ncbi:hypothetical protein BCR32DRAFT_330294 [Anaeromyces robustus]|uniref:Uncharacterized protein n=1 Tax=Anaeromyces robustus TaxID=1754192 RepID=A0A1Y1VY75_9FUNG|nr:hypothetical protein BCR32DRAFT_330294 [Anaeromyces robustus]|eukprot:ORX66242.1 hypothetical protein BCR32DRAFT_330294 [Anaeromyces robustus]
MGLDIYAGTLTRYYTHNWKTSVQQFAEKNGIKCKVIRQNVGDIPSPEIVLSDVNEWKEQLLKTIIPEDKKPYPKWNEDYDITPYYTNKPDWCAIGALMLYYVCHLYHQEFPKTIEKNYDFFKNELIQRAMDDNQIYSSLIKGGGWWAPIDDEYLFQFPLMGVNKMMIFGTVGQLHKELHQINQFEWMASQEEIIEWSKTEGYPTDITYHEGAVIDKNIHSTYDTLSLAKFAFSILWQAKEFSFEHRVFIIYDY